MSTKNFFIMKVMRVGLLLICLAICFSMTGCSLEKVAGFMAPKVDSVLTMKERLPELTQGQPKPIWQTAMKAQETDFIEFLSKDRVLIGTIEAVGLAWEPKQKEIMLLNAVNGEIVWVSPRNSFGNHQKLLLTAPVILLQGDKKCAAINPKDGTLIWERPPGDVNSLILPDGEHIVLFSQGKSSVSLSAVNMKDGGATWSASVENFKEAKDIALEANTVGAAVLLIGPEVVAISGKTGQLLWRKPFPGTFGETAATIVLGEDLYFTDGSSIARSDPASGSIVWREEFQGNMVRNMTASDSTVFVILREAGKDSSPDAIQALVRKTGKPLWKYNLLEQVQSAIMVEAQRIYLATESKLIAVDASRGSIVFQAAIPPNLQAPKLLPDMLRITNDGIVLAREIGVMAVQKMDGRLLYAQSITDGAPFTFNYTTHNMNNAFKSVTPTNKREQLNIQNTAMTNNLIYQMVLSNQQFMNAQQAQLTRIVAQYDKIGAINMQMKYERQAANLALVAAGVNAFASFMGAIGTAAMEEWRIGRVAVMKAEVNQSHQTHTISLQKDFYIRPRYVQDRGWFLSLVNLKTGKRADILLSPYNKPLSQAAPNLPAFSIDPSGSRILSKGLSLNIDQSEKYQKVASGKESQRTAISNWNIPYPYILAFDLTSLRFGQTSENQTFLPKPIDPEKKKLNDQLISAAFDNNLDTVKKMLDAGADVNAVDEYGQTALMLAAESLKLYGKNKIVKILLERGADISIKGS